MPFRHVQRPVLVLAALSAAVPASAQTAQGPDHSFTEAQAIEGQSLYYEHCLSCHGADLAGLDQAPPLAGPQFGAIWDGESLWSLVLRLDTMPPEKPGLLTRQQNVVLLAYMLWYNGWPIGDEPLATEQRTLENIRFTTAPRR